VIDHSIDFGVVSLPVNDKRLTVVPIHRDELVVICAPGHELSKCKSVTVEQVSRYPLLMPKFGKTRDAIEELFSAQNLTPTVSMELDSSELLKRFASADVGVGFIARSNIQEEMKAKTLVGLIIQDGRISRDLALVFRKDKALSRAALAFIEIAVKLKQAQPEKTSAR
jgi:DNA-binding transcriptional LysR family regulator